MTTPKPLRWEDLADRLTPMQKKFLGKFEPALIYDGLTEDRACHHAYTVATYFTAREDERYVRGK
jgi:hypothetical protein